MPLWEEMVASGGLPAGDPRIVEGGVRRAALDLLNGIELVQLDPETDRWLAQDPSGAQSRKVLPLSRQGAALLEESSHWAQALSGLAQTWRRAPLSASHESLSYLRTTAIGPFIAGIVAECEEELLTAQPQDGRDAPTLITAALRDTAALDRGVKMRTLYQHSARRSTITQKYVSAITARGAEVRTLDEFFNRLIVVDRRVAVVPGGDPDNNLAIAVRDSGLVGYLVDIFDRTWQRGRPFTSREKELMRDIAAEQQAMTIRMLVEGHADTVSAKRLGVSPRTYAGYVADLKTTYEAETRFQLGYVMGRQGLSGDEPVEGDGPSPVGA